MLTLDEIEERVIALTTNEQFGDDFIYDLLEAYGKAKSQISRLKAGSLNQSKDPSEIIWKKNIFYKHDVAGSLHIFVDSFKDNTELAKHHVRFVIASNGKQLVAMDTKTNDTLDIDINELDRHFTFFLPLAGMEKTAVTTEAHADKKAAYKMARIYDEIRKNNTSTDKEFTHALNVFFSRLLFCFFAEDTEVFTKGQFIGSITAHTQADGSDLHSYLDRLFKSFDVENKTEYPTYIQGFPYVNGGLFAKRFDAPLFTAHARRLVVECGELNWSQINPDIFGSMMQAVVDQGDRAALGMHYTSVPNIMKVIEPLFLNDLHEEFENSQDSVKKLEKLLKRLSEIKVFDPACGSGNFLIISYKELRKIEHQIIQRLIELEPNRSALFQKSEIKLENFYGIEIDDFAHEIAILSLWLAKHQMNIEFKELFGAEIPLVPLRDAGKIICANALRTDWKVLCPSTLTEEIYLIGNPPYQGSKKQAADQKRDIEEIFSTVTKSYKDLDYIAPFFYLGSKYISNSKAKLAFVTTNSICQGSQVSLLWPNITSLGVEISFAHRAFKWGNNAKGNAGVTCSIISLREKSVLPKYIYNGGLQAKVSKINSYLVEADDVIVFRRSKPLCHNLPKMSFGNMPVDGGNLILSKEDVAELLKFEPEAKKYVRELIGSEEYLNGKQRFCLWLLNSDLADAMKISEISSRVERVKKFRLSSRDAGTRKLAARPHQFREMNETNSNTIIVARVSSERREYIPFGFISKDAVIADAQAIYKAEPWVFGLISSKIHMVWTKAVAGTLGLSIRYSSALVYNNFPVPSLSHEQKADITGKALVVLAVRENHSEKTLAQMYDPDKMPDDLRKAHNELDEVVDSIYRSKPFANDEERLSHLFDLYEKMIAEEKGELLA